MVNPLVSLEPLADYLRPAFGNIYDYNFKAVNGFDMQEWTDELKDAVSQYLRDKVPEPLDDKLAITLFWSPDETADRERWVESIVENHQAWEIAHAFHQAAILSMPNLRDLIGAVVEDLDRWSWEDERLDVETWLVDNATEAELRDVCREIGEDGDLGQLGYAEALIRKPTPALLLRAWDRSIGPALSDLTDSEWVLLRPYLPNRSSARNAMNGILYRFCEDVAWSHVPARYGKWRNLSHRWYNYTRRGCLRKACVSLQGKPEAEDLVRRLGAIVT